MKRPVASAVITDEPVAERAYRLILGAILDLRLLPGSAISENSLAERIGVSRTPIREALQRLEADGLVRVFRQRSSYVAPLDDQAIRSAYFVRLSLERTVAGEAARRRVDADVLDLARMVEEQRRLVAAGASDGFFESNLAFHHRMAVIADLTGVARVIESVRVHLERVRVAHLALTPSYALEPVVEEHAGIVEAIAAGDGAAAEAAMDAHIRRVLPRLDLLRRERPEFFTLPGNIDRSMELRPRL